MRGLAAAVLAAGLGCGAARAAPVEAYGQLPSMDNVTISPDGSKLAYVVPVKGKQVVVVTTTDTGAVVTGLTGTDQKVRNLIWADGDHLLVLKSVAGYVPGLINDKSEWEMAQSLDLPKRKASQLLQADQQVRLDSRITDTQAQKMNVIAGTPQPRIVDGKPVVFVRGVTFVDSDGAAALFSVDLATGRNKLVEHADSYLDDRDWLIDPSGQLLAQITYAEQTQSWILKLRRAGQWVNALAVRADQDPPEVEGLSPGGTALLVNTGAAGHDGLELVALKDGAITPAPEQFYGFEDYIADRATHRIIGGVTIGAARDYVFFAPADQAKWNGILKAFPGEQVELASWSDDRSRIVVKVTGQAHGVTYVMVDLNTHKATAIGDAYLGLKPQDVAPVDVVTYRATDGLKISAYLTEPNGRALKNLPLIVMPHGGPAAHDDPSFDWWAQALASRGYAVLQPQYRGSTGFGADFEDAGLGQWGRKMQSDLSDGVRALASKGMVDPKRVCIVGASYGGYAALAGVTLESGVYRCAVAVAGVSDLHKFLYAPDLDPKQSFNLRYWYRQLGVRSDGDPVVDQISPIKHVDKVSVPVLLIHGKDDSVVKFEQSRIMADALKDAKKPVEFVVLDGEDHWLSRSATREQMLAATVKFLEANNPPS